MDRDPVVVQQPLGEVVRHRVAQVVATDRDVDVAGLVGEEQGRLAGRVGASDHDRVPIGDRRGLELAGGVVDAPPLEVGQSREVETPVPHPARGDTTRVPNFTACNIAARASAPPDTPR